MLRNNWIINIRQQKETDSIFVIHMYPTFFNKFICTSSNIWARRRRELPHDDVVRPGQHPRVPALQDLGQEDGIPGINFNFQFLWHLF